MMSSAGPTVNNYIFGRHVPPSTDRYLSIYNPATSLPIGKVALSDSSDVDSAVRAANEAFPSWAKLTIKARAAIMLSFHSLVKQHADELAALIVLENGKNLTEALADVAKGNETVEYACSLPQLAQGKIDRVSGEVSCRDRRDALGVIVSIVPFNFPFMVPMWTLPIALVLGNTVVLKPSEKVPMTMYKVMELFEKAGFPPGVINLIQGTSDAVQNLIAHPLVKAVTFVGSSPIAKLVSSQCHSLHKRCIALGGAKNHLVALPDCDIESTATDIVVSYAGCAGQRCMAASVLLIVGPSDGQAQKALLDTIIEKAAKIKAGTGPGEMGPVIDRASLQKILGYIERSEKEGAQILLDGRSWNSSTKNDSINNDIDNGSNLSQWIGPTILLHHNKTDSAMREEVFGPVLSVHHVPSWQEAVAIENSNPFGNAAAIYTTNGGHADWFLGRFRASMLGVNIGIPVPREPFSFGGLYGTQSKYGDMDITGEGAIEFFTNRIKITTRWPAPTAPEYIIGSKEMTVQKQLDQVTLHDERTHDRASFFGRM